MFADEFRRLSRYDAMHSPDSPEAKEYLIQAPFYIIMDFLTKMPQADRSGRQVAKNASLINPFLGKPNYISELYENQLNWIAETWANLCNEAYQAFGEQMAVTPLLIGGGERGTYVITMDGKIIQVED